MHVCMLYVMCMIRMCTYIHMYMLFSVKGLRGKFFKTISHLSISQIKFQGYSELTLLCTYNYTYVYTIMQGIDFQGRNT